MRILKEIELITDAWNVPNDKLVFTYAPREGLFVWWMTSNTDQQFKYPDFVKETLEFQGGWWVKLAYDLMDWSCSYVGDPDEVDLGPYPFKMTKNEFFEHYRTLWNSEYNEKESTVNVVGVDYNYIFSDKVDDRPLVNTPQTHWQPQAIAAFLQAGQAPNLAGVKEESDKFLAFSHLRRLMFNGLIASEAVQREIIGRLFNNREDVTRLLRNLK